MNPAAVAVISLSVMMIGGFLMPRLTNLLHLPNITADMPAGVLFGPFCLNLIPRHTGFWPDTGGVRGFAAGVINLFPGFEKHLRIASITFGFFRNGQTAPVGKR